MHGGKLGSRRKSAAAVAGSSSSALPAPGAVPGLPSRVSPGPAQQSSGQGAPLLHLCLQRSQAGRQLLLVLQQLRNPRRRGLRGSLHHTTNAAFSALAPVQLPLCCRAGREAVGRARARSISAACICPNAQPPLPVLCVPPTCSRARSGLTAVAEVSPKALHVTCSKGPPAAVASAAMAPGRSGTCRPRSAPASQCTLPSRRTTTSLKACWPGGSARLPAQVSPSPHSSAGAATGSQPPSCGQLPTTRRCSPNWRWQAGAAKATCTGLCDAAAAATAAALSSRAAATAASANCLVAGVGPAAAGGHSGWHGGGTVCWRRRCCCCCRGEAADGSHALTGEFAHGRSPLRARPPAACSPPPPHLCAAGIRERQHAAGRQGGPPPHQAVACKVQWWAGAEGWCSDTRGAVTARHRAAAVPGRGGLASRPALLTGCIPPWRFADRPRRPQRQQGAARGDGARQRRHDGAVVRLCNQPLLPQGGRECGRSPAVTNVARGLLIGTGMRRAAHPAWMALAMHDRRWEAAGGGAGRGRVAGTMWARRPPPPPPPGRASPGPIPPSLGASPAFTGQRLHKTGQLKLKLS